MNRDRAGFIVVTLLSLALAGISLVAGLKLRESDQLLLESAEIVQSTVIKKQKRRESKKMRYKLYLEYEFPAGETRSDVERVSKETYALTEIGDTLPLYVATTDPEVARLEHNMPTNDNLTPFLLMPTLFLIFAGMFAYAATQHD